MDEYGARPLKRKIQKEILTPLASFIIEEGLKEGGSVDISVKKSGEIGF